MKKILLLILDGWGINPDKNNNAIAQANPGYWNHLLDTYPHSTLHAREASVGLSSGHLSNSEVGHTAIGAGRVVPQSAYAIDVAIKNGVFGEAQALRELDTHASEHTGVVHLVGLLSNGGVHAHIDHLLALLEWTKERNIEHVVLHLFLDGRDMAPMSGAELLAVLEQHMEEHMRIATICGRSIGMDRAENWDRTVAAYNNIVHGTDIEASTPISLVQENYAEQIGDEFLETMRFTKDTIQDGDAVLFFNFRADRMRQMLRLFGGIAPNAVQQSITVPNNLFLASMANYDDTYEHVHVLFPKTIPHNNIGEWISKQDMKQLRITETEKYAHITYFINGGQEITYKNEERLIIPSLGLQNYTPHPEMSLHELTNSLLRALQKEHFEFIICNIPNGDMLGHTGNIDAATKAVGFVDLALSQIIPEAERLGYTTVITADHGNIEYMEHNGGPHTAHTFNDVPFLVTDTSIKLSKTGFLHQTSPTILNIFGLDKPKEMDSTSLLVV